MMEFDLTKVSGIDTSIVLSEKMTVGEGDDAEGDILAEAVPLDVAHTVDEAQVDDLMLEIMENPPTLPVNPSGQDDRIEEEVHA